MKYVVAVSGGVDSVVLLDMLVKSGEHDLVVAHFDHGIRPESDWEARFVEALANRYGLTYVTKREELGAGASEATARQRRYSFLREVATQYDAAIATAHHKDDVIETIAINMTRGTGWRGLAVLGDPTMYRPLVDRSKAELYAYAIDSHLEWIEDETNRTGAYLRNRVRGAVSTLPVESKDALAYLWQKQRAVAKAVDQEASGLATNSRYFLTMIDESSALELLRSLLMRRGDSLTRPQRRRLLLGVKAAKPGTTLEAGPGVNVRFTKREFIVKYP